MVTFVMVTEYVKGFVAEMSEEREGQGLVEYALIIAIVSVLIAGSLATFRGEIEAVFTAIGTALG